MLSLSPDIVAVYLQAATKVFGVWASELAERWDSDDLPKVKEVVESNIECLASFASSPDIEVQERVRTLTCHYRVNFHTHVLLGRKYAPAFHFHPSRLGVLPSTRRAQLWI